MRGMAVLLGLTFYFATLDADICNAGLHHARLPVNNSLPCAGTRPYRIPNTPVPVSKRSGRRTWSCVATTSHARRSTEGNPARQALCQRSRPGGRLVTVRPREAQPGIDKHVEDR